MTIYRVCGPWNHMAVRNNELVEIEPGGTFTDAEIPPDCQIDLNVAAGVVEVVPDKADVKADKAGKAPA